MSEFRFISDKKNARYKSSDMQPFRAPDVDSLITNDGKLLAEMISEFIKVRVPRYDRLDDYYMAENTEIYSKGDRSTRFDDAGIADHKISHSWGEFITSFQTSFIAGKPITYDGADEALSDIMQTFNTNNDIDMHNMEVFTEASIYGEGNELIYRVETEQGDVDRVVVLPRMNSFLIYDMTLENKELAGVYFIMQKIGNETQTSVTLYTDHEVFESSSVNLVSKKILFLDAKWHPYGEVPMISYKNNKHRLGDYERQIPLIDAYDAAVSDTTNYMTDLTDAILTISGDINPKISDQMVDTLKKARILLLGDLGTGDAVPTKAEYLYKQYDVAGVEAHKSRLENDIHKLSYTPNFNDEKFGGNLSGEALKYKLVGLDQVRAIKESYYSKGLAKRYRLLANANKLAGVSEDLTFQFHPNLPQPVLDELKTYTDAGGVLSDKTMLSVLSFIDNPQDELDRIRQEEIEGMGILTQQDYPEQNA